MLPGFTFILTTVDPKVFHEHVLFFTISIQCLPFYCHSYLCVVRLIPINKMRHFLKIDFIQFDLPRLFYTSLLKQSVDEVKKASFVSGSFKGSPSRLPSLFARSDAIYPCVSSWKNDYK